MPKPPPRICRQPNLGTSRQASASTFHQLENTQTAIYRICQKPHPRIGHADGAGRWVCWSMLSPDLPILALRAAREESGGCSPQV